MCGWTESFWWKNKILQKILTRKSMCRGFPGLSKKFLQEETPFAPLKPERISSRKEGFWKYPAAILIGRIAFFIAGNSLLSRHIPYRRKPL